MKYPGKRYKINRHQSTSAAKQFPRVPDRARLHGPVLSLAHRVRAHKATSGRVWMSQISGWIILRHNKV